MKKNPQRGWCGRGAAAAILILLIQAGSPTLAETSLMARRDFRVGDHPVVVLAVDFDSDGHLDLLSLDQIPDQISLMKGFGDGSFRLFGAAIVGLTPTGLAYADVNNDGHDDLIASNFLTQDVTVNLGDGTGGFGLKQRSPSGSTPFGVVVGHWDGDGILDVATANSTLDSLSIMFGIGNGFFTAPQYIAAGDEPRHLIKDDFDDDGKPDLAVANRISKNIQIWRGNGTGGFSLLSTIAAGLVDGPVFLASGDYNKDGDVDLVVCLQADNTVRLLPGNGAGGFGTATNLSPGLGPRSARLADLNLDNNPDLLVSMSLVSGVGELAVLYGNGAGGFGAPIITNTGPLPTSIAVGDFDEDGQPDVVTANQTSDILSVIKGAGGAFVEAARLDLAPDSFPYGVAVGDFNNDTVPDVASANLLGDSVAVAFGNGSGGFLPPTTYDYGVENNPIALVPVDLNADSHLDLVVINVGESAMVVMPNSGTGNRFSTPPSNNHQALGSCAAPVDIAVGEITGDMILDVAFVCQDSHHLCTRIGTGQNGTNAFGPPNCTALVEREPSGVVLGNFTLDALEDAAITSRLDDVVVFANADGAGGVLDIPATFVVGTDPVGIARGDVNNDGFEDVVITNTFSATISTYLMDGGGAPLSFPAIVSPAGVGPFDLALADFNLDGNADVAVVNGNANNVSLLLGDGFGNFSKAGDFGVRNLPLGVAVADFNDDGWPDLAVSDHYGDSISILLNQSVLTVPLQDIQVFQTTPLVLRWGLVPGASYDVVRSEISSVVVGLTEIDLGPALCVAEDLPITDTANFPDLGEPTLGEAYVYFIRPTIAGVAGSYGTSDDGLERLTPASGCAP